MPKNQVDARKYSTINLLISAIQKVPSGYRQHADVIIQSAINASAMPCRNAASAK